MRDGGGPAFPHAAFEFTGGGGVDQRLHVGAVTLRDYFAAAALTAGWRADVRGPCTPETAAASAYEFADAMLAERAK